MQTNNREFPAPAQRPFARLALAAALALAVTTGAARAGNDSWTFSLSPYLWIAGISGTVDTKSSTTPSRDVDISFGETLDNLSGIGLMLAGEASYNRFHLLGDFLWLTVSADIKTKGVLFGGGHAKASVLQGELVGMYRFVKSGPWVVDGGMGMRLWSLSVDARLNPGLLKGAKADANTTWVDPIFGGRVMVRFGGDWSATFYADIGGFGVSSDFTWQALATINYSVAKWADLRVGYRHMGVYRDKADLDLSGPIVAATFKF